VQDLTSELLCIPNYIYFNNMELCL